VVACEPTTSRCCWEIAWKWNLVPTISLVVALPVANNCDVIDNLIQQKTGIIFIDCWQSIVGNHWTDVPDQFDFYKNMMGALQPAYEKNLVFHTGVYGDQPLSSALQSWSEQVNSIDIMWLEDFARHYQARKIFNWIVVGGHWQRCTHTKPLGFYNLLDLKKLDSQLRIFSYPECTVKFVNDDIEHPIVSTCKNYDYQQDNLIWQAQDRLFELVGP
jgi:hypothetical protein